MARTTDVLTRSGVLDVGGLDGLDGSEIRAERSGDGMEDGGEMDSPKTNDGIVGFVLISWWLDRLDGPFARGETMEVGEMDSPKTTGSSCLASSYFYPSVVDWVVSTDRALGGRRR